MASSFNAAWQEAEATAPAGVTLLCTLELQHPTFLDGGGQPYGVRLVTGVDADQVLTLEAGAPLNGGAAVTFTAIPFTAERPTFAEGQVPTCDITVDNVGRELVPVLEAAAVVRADLIAIYREYRSDDLTEPCFGPVQFVIKKVAMTGTALTGTAMIDNLANRKFPSRNYTIVEFPGLI
jgi:hypothetical protein